MLSKKFPSELWSRCDQWKYFFLYLKSSVSKNELLFHKNFIYTREATSIHVKMNQVIWIKIPSYEINQKEDTVWKFHDFSILQILREIDFDDTRSATSAILTHLVALNFVFCEFLHFLKAEISQINKIQSKGKHGSFTASKFSKIDFT